MASWTSLQERTRSRAAFFRTLVLRVPALEVMVATYAIRNLIRKGSLHQLYNEMQVGRAQGMRSMEESLTDLVRRGRIDVEEARCRATRPDELERLLQR